MAKKGVFSKKVLPKDRYLFFTGSVLWYFYVFYFVRPIRPLVLRISLWKHAQRRIARRVHGKCYISVNQDNIVVVLGTPDVTYSPYWLINWMGDFIKQTINKFILSRKGTDYRIRSNIQIFEFVNVFTFNPSISTRWFLNNNLKTFLGHLGEVDRFFIDKLITASFYKFLKTRRDNRGNS